MVALAVPVAALCGNHSWAWLSPLEHKECKPRQAAADLKPGKQRKREPVRSQVCWGTLRRAHPDYQGCCLRGDQAPGRAGGHEAPGLETALRLRGARIRWYWELLGELRLYSPVGLKAPRESLLPPQKTCLQRDALHCPPLKIILHSHLRAQNSLCIHKVFWPYRKKQNSQGQKFSHFRDNLFSHISPPLFCC